MTRLLLACTLLVAAAAAARGAPVEDWPCVACHPSRDRTAFQQLARRRGVLLGDESAQAFVCLSCHNGSVRDDRERLFRRGQHPTGIRPARPVPEPFRLYPGGRIECGTCHSPHAPGEAGRRWLRALPTGNEPCASCHPGRDDLHLGREPAPDGAAAVEARGGRLEKGRIVCATCHTVHGARGPSLLIAAYGSDRSDLCRLCHEDLAVKGSPPGTEPLACAECHTPHSSRPLMASPRSSCARCHPSHAGKGEHPAGSPSCSECHSVHAPVRPRGYESALLRLPPWGGGLCLPCHPDQGARHGPSTGFRGTPPAVLERKGIVLGTGGAVECLTCHRAHNARFEPLLVLEGGVLCLYCHPDQSPFGPRGLKPGVHPVAVPAAAGGVLTCRTCHSAHGKGTGDTACRDCHGNVGAARGHGGKAGCGACHGIHAAEAPAGRCARCHGEADEIHPAGTGGPPGRFPLWDGAGRRSPWGRMDCPTCHDPHAPDAALRAGAAGALCLGCHPGKEPVSQGPHRSPSGGPCGTCHPPHRKTGGDLEARCRRCHGGELTVLPAHTSGGTPAWKRNGGRLPLFDRFGRRNPFGFMECATCHDVHRPDGLRAVLPRLCLACHGEKASLLGSAHAPRQQGEGAACSACHPMHARKTVPSLWDLRAGAQGTWNDRNCSPCHGPPRDGPLPHGGPRSHPVNRPLPDRMDPGGLPLFDPLGGRPGRLLTCSTCHDIHGVLGASGEVLPRFLRMPPDDGALCVTCHQGPAAVLNTPHDLRGQGKDLALGPCSPCHRAHRARADRRLWGLEPAGGDYWPNRLCRSCHRIGGPVDTERPLLQYHMKDAEAVLTPRGTIYLQRPRLLMDEWAIKRGRDPVIPLYDREGTPGPSGNLQCVSCHDPHQWSPMGPFIKPGFGALGPNVPTRFLRLEDPREAARSVCAVCHTEDAVERYRRYHDVWTDVGAEYR